MYLCAACRSVRRQFPAQHERRVAGTAAFLRNARQARRAHVA